MKSNYFLFQAELRAAVFLALEEQERIEVSIDQSFDLFELIVFTENNRIGCRI